MTSRPLERLPISTLLLCVIDSGGDAGVFCYRIGVDIFAAGRARFARPLPVPADTLVVEPPQAKRIQAACSNLFSTLSTHFSTQKD
jgi:hypothetical protein